MPRATERPTVPATASATVGYEAQLWQMADALRGSMDAAEYKHVCLGLLFLKYISDQDLVASSYRRATRRRPHPRDAVRQDRAEPAGERVAGGEGARTFSAPDSRRSRWGGRSGPSAEIRKSSFRPIRTVAPANPVMHSFDRVPHPMYLDVVEHERESRTLAALRDALLPRLISDELRIRVAEGLPERTPC